MIGDYNQYGYSCVTSNEQVTQEPISLAEVKEYLGIGFEQHDSALLSLIKNVRSAVEKRLSITLIDSRDVSVRWLQFYDSFTLPYQKIEGHVEAHTIDGGYLDLHDIENSGGLAILKGSFPDGIKLSYRSVKVSDNFIRDIKSAMIRSTAELFENHELSVYESVKKQFKGVSYAEV